MDFMSIFNSEFNSLTNFKMKNDILSTNNFSSKFGLILSENDAEMLIQAGASSIKDNDRIEFGESATIKIINKFLQSSYISQDNYAETIAGLIDVFYTAKDECYDMLSDEELIDIMFDFFEVESGGSLEILQNRDLDLLCRKIRSEALGITYDD